MTKKHYFVLRNIDPVEIDNKYSFYVQQHNIIPPPIVEEYPQQSRKDGQRTKIADLTPRQKDQNTFSYLDESKKEHICVLTMTNQDDQTDIPDRTTISCFWCRHSFENRPLGCPIQYVPHRVVKSYYSEITKDNYTLRESISDRQFQDNIDSYNDLKMNVTERSHYITDGVFCSFNCCLAFIRDNNNNPLYTYSENLLQRIYIDLFGSQAQPITQAPSWRLLSSYGGCLSVDDFRKNFYNVEYKDVDNPIMPSIRLKSIGFLYEKQVRI